MATRPAIFGVLQRIEYRYADKDRLLGPKMDGAIKYGTYGTIEVTVVFWYPTIPGKIYHPINNAPEGLWWLDFYREHGEFVSAVFLPAPNQYSAGEFEIPDLEEYPDPEEAVDWYSPGFEADAYSR